MSLPFSRLSRIYVGVLEKATSSGEFQHLIMNQAAAFQPCSRLEARLSSFVRPNGVPSNRGTEPVSIFCCFRQVQWQSNLPASPAIFKL
jgi:hypothetical protein